MHGSYSRQAIKALTVWPGPMLIPLWLILSTCQDDKPIRSCQLLRYKPVTLDGSLVAVRGVVVFSIHTYTLFIYRFSEKFTSFAHPQIAMANLKRHVLTKPITREEEDKKYKETSYRIFFCV